jgi:hypothetical protein
MYRNLCCYYLRGRSVGQAGRCLASILEMEAKCASRKVVWSRKDYTALFLTYRCENLKSYSCCLVTKKPRRHYVIFDYQQYSQYRDSGSNCSFNWTVFCRMKYFALCRIQNVVVGLLVNFLFILYFNVSHTFLTNLCLLEHGWMIFSRVLMATSFKNGFLKTTHIQREDRPYDTTDCPCLYKFVSCYAALRAMVRGGGLHSISYRSYVTQQWPS